MKLRKDEVFVFEKRNKTNIKFIRKYYGDAAEDFTFKFQIIKRIKTATGNVALK